MSSISAGTTTGTALVSAGDTTGELVLKTNGTTTAVTIDASQNVGVGTTSPASRLNVVGATGVATVRYTGRSSDNSTTVDFYSNNNATRYGFQYYDATGAQYYTSASIPLAFGTAGTERMRIDTSGNLLFNSGYGSVATAYGCRAWVNFNGTGTVAIRASGNVSSITDGGTGVYAVNFATAMPDANYSVCGITADFNSPNRMIAIQQNTAPSTSSVTVATFTTGGSLSDEEINSVAIFR
jgi:hypothetical protein